jgi:hypothetical protein
MQVQPGLFINPIEAIKRTVIDEGFLALWRGSVPAFIGALGENAMAFGVNGFLKRILKDNNEPSLIQHFITGGITGAFHNPRRLLIDQMSAMMVYDLLIGACTPLVLCPCDVLKCRAQMNRASGNDSSLRYVIRSTYQRQGSWILDTADDVP